MAEGLSQLQRIRSRTLLINFDMKYIDADKLIKAIEEKGLDCSFVLKMERLDTLALIDSLQKEQNLIVINKKDWEAQEQFRKNKDFGKPLQQEQQDKKEIKFVFPKFLYARTTNNKTIDVSYAPQSLDAIEYIRSDSLQQEQPEVDLENYISNKLRELGADLINHKPYSFNRGLNVGKTKAYEDILGRLNTRKEE